jgi:transcriptional regulator with XRE-family HTH domain
MTIHTTIEVELIWAVRRLREARNWSQRELGRRSGVSPHTITRNEAMETQGYRLNTLKKLADALGLRVSDILKEIGE